MAELFMWVCATCGRAVDVASDRKVANTSPAALLARNLRTMGEHTQCCGCPPGLELQIITSFDERLGRYDGR